MSQKGEGKVKPGQCDPVYGAPPPKEIVCIQVDKVYQECKKVQVNEVEIIKHYNQAVVDVLCLGVELLSHDCKVLTPGRVKVHFTYKIRLRVIFENQSSKEITHVVEEYKTVLLARAGEEGLKVKCDIILEGLECHVDEAVDPYDEMFRSTIVCCVGKMILVKLFAKVQLMIPAYGFCPQPPDCEEVLDICPDFHPQWPPYPPRDD